ncbi:hypothetical protein ACS0TY_027161 [Phlomoides rotata]
MSMKRTDETQNKAFQEKVSKDSLEEAEMNKEEHKREGEHLKRKIKHVAKKRSPRGDQQTYPERPLDVFVEEFIEKADLQEWNKAKKDFQLEYYVVKKLETFQLTKHLPSGWKIMSIGKNYGRR